MDPNLQVVSELARRTLQSCCHATIRQLQKLPPSPEDWAGITRSFWDEFCLQVQVDETVAWEVYQDAARDVIAGVVSKVPILERQALWLQTESGSDWESEDAKSANGIPCSIDDIEAAVLREVMRKAGDWTNISIRAWTDDFYRRRSAHDRECW